MFIVLPGSENASDTMGVDVCGVFLAAHLAPVAPLPLRSLVLWELTMGVDGSVATLYLEHSGLIIRLKNDFLSCLMFFSLKRSCLGTTAPHCVAVPGTTSLFVWIIPVTAPERSAVKLTEC